MTALAVARAPIHELLDSRLDPDALLWPLDTVHTVVSSEPTPCARNDGATSAIAPRTFASELTAVPGSVP